jgi:hypothetical protein
MPQFVRLETHLLQGHLDSRTGTPSFAQLRSPSPLLLFTFHGSRPRIRFMGGARNFSTPTQIPALPSRRAYGPAPPQVFALTSAPTPRLSKFQLSLSIVFLLCPLPRATLLRAGRSRSWVTIRGPSAIAARTRVNRRTDSISPNVSSRSSLVAHSLLTVDSTSCATATPSSGARAHGHFPEMVGRFPKSHPA